MSMTPTAADPAAIPATAPVLKPPLSLLSADFVADAVLVAALVVLLAAYASGSRKACLFFESVDRTAGKSLLCGHPLEQGLTSQQPMNGGSMFSQIHQTSDCRLSSQLWVVRSSNLSASKEAVRSWGFSHRPLPSAQGSMVQHPMNSFALPSQM